jgi:hypothetical protein
MNNNTQAQDLIVSLTKFIKDFPIFDLEEYEANGYNQEATDIYEELYIALGRGKWEGDFDENIRQYLKRPDTTTEQSELLTRLRALMNDYENKTCKQEELELELED